METLNNRGTISIETNNDNRKRVVFSPVNGTVQLAKCELVELFGVYMQTVNACIEAILKTGVPDAEATCKCHLITQIGGGKYKIKCEPYEFGIEFIIAMAFRIDSENADLIRQWVVKQLLADKMIFLSTAMLNTQNQVWN